MAASEKMHCSTVVLGRCDWPALNAYMCWYVLVENTALHLVARISCTSFLAAASGKALKSGATKQRLRGGLSASQRARQPRFPSVFATWPASLACHEQSEVFEPDIRSTCL